MTATKAKGRHRSPEAAPWVPGRATPWIIAALVLVVGTAAAIWGVSGTDRTMMSAARGAGGTEATWPAEAPRTWATPTVTPSSPLTTTTTTTPPTPPTPTPRTSSTAPVAPRSTSASPTSGPAPAPPQPGPPAPARLADKILDLVNAERERAGCQPVRAQAQLARAAQAHSADMARNDYFSHTSLDGRSPTQRMRDAGWTGSATGENIAAGQVSAAAVMKSWMNSPGHRANILNCRFTSLGVGYAEGGTYHRYWTQDFGG